MNRKLSKNLIIITSIVMFMLGAIVGFSAMWQFLSAHPQKVSDSLKYVFYIASGLFAGLLLFFSAKPVLFLLYAVGNALKKAFGRTKPLDIAGMLLGVMIGIMIAYLADALLSLVLKIIAARIIIDVIVGLSASLVAILLCTKFLSNTQEDVDVPAFSGYLLSSSALNNVKIVPLCSAWLSGNVYALSITVSNIINQNSNGNVALQNYSQLVKNGLKTINSTGEDETSLVISVAETRGFKIICESAAEYENLTSIVSVLGLDTL